LFLNPQSSSIIESHPPEAAGKYQSLLVILRSCADYYHWIGFVGKIETGNPWFLPSNLMGFPVKMFPSSNSMILGITK